MRHGLLVQGTAEQLEEIIEIVGKHVPMGIGALRRAAEIIIGGEDCDLYQNLIALESDQTLQARAIAITGLCLADGTLPEDGFPLGALAADDVIVLMGSIADHPSLASSVWARHDTRFSVAMTAARMFVDPERVLTSMRELDKRLVEQYSNVNHQT